MTIGHSSEPKPEPYAVTIPETRRLCGDAGRSTIYVLIGRGQLVAIKAGARTLVTTESIRTYLAGLPRAKIKPPPRRRQRGRQKK